MTGPTRILIAGIGNIFMGDDAFGVEIAQRMARMPLPSGVRVVDFGIRGIDLTYSLLDGCELAILVDAVSRGQAPGTVYLIEPDSEDAHAAPGMPMLDMHNMDPARVLAVVRSQGGNVRRVLLVGCEPVPFDPEQDIQVDLSPPVKAAIGEAIKLIESLVERFFAEDETFHAPSPGSRGAGWGEGLWARCRTLTLILSRRTGRGDQTDATIFCKE